MKFQEGDKTSRHFGGRGLETPSSFLGKLISARIYESMRHVISFCPIRLIPSAKSMYIECREAAMSLRSGPDQLTDYKTPVTVICVMGRVCSAKQVMSLTN